MKPSKPSLCLIAIMVTEVTVWRTAAANLRGPTRVPHLPSSAMRGLDESLVVRGEDLSFICDVARCQVIARYSINAARDAQTQLQFILPVQPIGGAVRVIAGAKTMGAAVETAELDPAERERLPNVPHQAPLLRARFDMDFHPGRNEIAVEYLQPLGVEEVDYGYFWKGALIRRWDYELWPVAEWKRAADFAINVAVTVPRTMPTRWQRWFGTVESISCSCIDSSRVSRDRGRLEQIGQRLEYRFRITGAIPIRLECGWGDQKHLRREE